MAESYARIFFRNCIATGEIYPYECPGIRLCEEVKTGDEVGGWVWVWAWGGKWGWSVGTAVEEAKSGRN